MGVELYLYTADESIKSPYLSRNFKDEIAFDWYLDLSSFLSPEEIDLITPNTYGEITLGEKKTFDQSDKSRILDKISDAISGKGSLNDMSKVFDEFLITSEKIEDRERDPSKLKSVLKKIEDQLKSKSDEFPLIHTVYEDEECEDEVYIFIINGVKAHIEGDLFYEDDYDQIRNKIQIKSYLDDFGKVDFKVDATPQIEINNQTYFTKSLTKAQQFEPEFKQCYDFLDLAIKQNQKVLWELG